MTISCVCIVKNGELTLEKCLDSVKDIVDEFIVVDTGSTDNTREIIKKYGKLYEIPFEDFAITKNKALELATCDFILFMDADEYVIEGLDKLKKYAEVSKCVSCRIVEGSDTVTVNTYFRNRLWRNVSGWRFTGRVHETANGPGEIVTDGSIKVRHDHAYKADKPEVYKERFEGYVNILTAYIKENPNATRERFYLARAYKDLGRKEEAISMYKEYLSQPTIFFRDEIWQSWYDIACCLKERGEYDQAFEALAGAKKVDPRRAEAYNLEGLMYYNRQDWELAIGCYKKALSLDFPEDVVLFINPREYKEVPADNISICYNALKQFGAGEKHCIIANEGNVHFHNQRLLNNLWWFRVKTHMKIFLALGITPEKVYGGMIDKVGVGGVETTYIELAKDLSRMGHTVFLFCNCDDDHIYNGVYYIPYQKMETYTGFIGENIHPDVIITSRWFDSLYFENESIKIIWFQDAYFAEPNRPDVFSKANGIVCSSKWHRNYIAERYSHGIKAEKIRIIPLGIRKELFQGKMEKDPNKVIYSSNPDRGLYILLNMWEEITKEVPDIQLYIYYGWEGLKTWGKSKEWEDSVNQQMKNAYDKASSFNNIHFKGRVTKKELAEEMLTASLCVYPNNFWETSCLTSLECQMAGVPTVTTDRGALKTTLNNDCNILIDSNPYGIEYRKQFISEVKNLMTNSELLSDYSRKCREYAMNAPLDWEDVAKVWQQYIWEVGN